MNKYKENVGAHDCAQKEKGITLIALIITIIVMLILVAVTISMAVNGGLFEYAGKATGEMQNAIDEEQKLAEGKIKIGETWYNSIDEYIGTIDWTAILASANANPESYKHEGQLVSTYIGIGTDGKPVNMDLWIPTLLDDGTWCLGSQLEVYRLKDSYTGEYEGGEIQGKIPQYIYNTEEKSFKPVVRMNSTFAMSEIEKAPTLPSTVTTIIGIFYECPKLKGHYEIPSTVTNIGHGAFFNCTGLTSVEISDGVTSIGASAFKGCTGLTDVTISNSVTRIDGEAFYNVPHISYTGTATGSPWGALSIN